MKIIINIPDDGDLTLAAHIKGEERPSQKQAAALRDLVMLAGYLRGDLLGDAAEAVKQ